MMNIDRELSTGNGLSVQESNETRLTLKQRIQIKIRKRIEKKPNAIITSCVAALLVAAMFLVGILPHTEAEISASDYQNEFLQLSFVGDVMLGRYIEAYAEKNGYEGFFSGVSDIWSNSDFVFANFEGALVPGGAENYVKRDQKKGPYLSLSEKSVYAMMDAGINTISIANNHCTDYGPEAYHDAVEWLKTTGINYAGNVSLDDRFSRVSGTVLEAQGLNIGFIAFTDAFLSGTMAAGVLTSRHSFLYRLINDSAVKNDLTVVYVHWGSEYTSEPNENQIKLGHDLIDAGADIVIGCHPHAVQPVEKYGRGIIFYSLGNFIMDQNNTFTRDSVLVQYNQSEDGSGFFELIPVRIYDGRPVPLDEGFYSSRILRVMTKKLDSSEYSVKDNGHVIIEF